MRGFVQDLYGVPRERAIGSMVAYRYEKNEAGDVIVQRAELDVANDDPAKPVAIWSAVGRHPILAVGNSNDDLQMLTFAGGPELPALRILVLHDDADREFDYVTGAEKVIDVVQTQGWATVSIKREWRAIFPG